MDHGEKRNFGRYEVTALESLHDTGENSLIYLIKEGEKVLLYGTDLLMLSEKAWKVLRNYHLDAVVLDQTYGKGCNAGGHLDGGQVVHILNRMREEQLTDEKSLLYATHISHEGNDIHEKMEEEVGRSGYHIAYDGLELLF